jgi:hypothetical protein
VQKGQKSPAASKKIGDGKKMETQDDYVLKVVQHSFFSKSLDDDCSGLIVLLDANNRTPIEIGLYKRLKNLGAIEMVQTSKSYEKKLFLHPFAIRELIENGYRLKFASGQAYSEVYNA